MTRPRPNVKFGLTASHRNIVIFFVQPFSLLFLCLSVLSVIWSIWLERRHGEPAADAGGQAG